MTGWKKLGAAVARQVRKDARRRNHEGRRIAASHHDSRQIAVPRHQQREELEAAPAAPLPRPVVAQRVGQVAVLDRGTHDDEVGALLDVGRDRAHSLGKVVVGRGVRVRADLRDGEEIQPVE